MDNNKNTRFQLMDAHQLATFIMAQPWDESFQFAMNMDDLSATDFPDEDIDALDSGDFSVWFGIKRTFLFDGEVVVAGHCGGGYVKAFNLDTPDYFPNELFHYLTDYLADHIYPSGKVMVDTLSLSEQETVEKRKSIADKKAARTVREKAVAEEWQTYYENKGKHVMRVDAHEVGNADKDGYIPYMVTVWFSGGYYQFETYKKWRHRYDYYFRRYTTIYAGYDGCMD